MNQERFTKAVRIAHDRMRAKNYEASSDEDLVALALMSACHCGPWEEQAKRLTAWGNEREERFSAVRAVLDAFHVTVHEGNLEQQVQALGNRTTRALRQLAGIVEWFEDGENSVDEDMDGFHGEERQNVLRDLRDLELFLTGKL